MLDCKNLEINSVAVTAAATMAVVIFRQLAIVAETGRITVAVLEAAVSVAAVLEVSAVAAALAAAVPDEVSNYE